MDFPPPAQRASWVVLGGSLVVLLTLGWLLARAPSSPASPVDSWLPLLNAVLNAGSAVCLLFGYAAIRRRLVSRHRRWMLSAAALSAAFLVSYVWHHYHVGSVPFIGPRWLRLTYLSVLLPHVVLSAAIVPLVPLTLWWGWQHEVARHRRLARWTLPLWLVVSATGVLVYVFVYHWNAWPE